MLWLLEPKFSFQTYSNTFGVGLNAVAEISHEF